MGKKDKRYWRDEAIIGYWMSGIFLVAIFVLVVLNGISGNNLKQELESCQDKIPVWTLKVKCVYDSNPDIYGEGIIILNFTDYSEYRETIKSQKTENCEVME